MSELTITEESLRKMPHSLEAEQSVLGTVLMDAEKFRELAPVLKPEDFYLEQHRIIYEAMRDIFLRGGTQLDAVTLIDELVSNGSFEKAGGRKYVMLLAETAPSAFNLTDYIGIIRKHATLRRLIAAADEISTMAYAGAKDAEEVVDRAEQLVFDVAGTDEVKNFVHIRDAVKEHYDYIESVRQYGASALGTPTGFSDIDRVLVGMGKGDLIIIGARPGMGKTAFALNIAANCAIRMKKTVVIFSLEMSAMQLAARMLSSESMIDNTKMRSGELEDNEWLKLADAAACLTDADLYIDDTAGATVMGIKAKLRRIQNLGLVVIDYLQLMHSEHRIDNRTQEIGEISRNLKLLAKELAVPVVTCAQLSRTNESRTDKTPVLSDLRDSGAIEQDADIVMFLHREGYYDTQNEDKKNLATCIIAKNRHGSTDNVKLHWQGQYTRFSCVANQSLAEGGGN